MGFTIFREGLRDITGGTGDEFVFEVHAPVGIKNGDFSQLESRLNHDLIPSIIVSGGPLSVEDRERLEKEYLETDRIKEVSFDMNIVSQEPVTKGWEFYHGVMDFVAGMHKKFPDKVSKRIGIKFGQADPEAKGSFLGSRITLSELEQRYGANINLVENLLESSEFIIGRGLTFGIENSPVPNFAVTPTGVVDSHKRWNNKGGTMWGPGPRNTASLFAHPREIMYVLNRRVMNNHDVTIDLDLEHEIQTVAGFSFLSLDRATGGVMKYGDLTDQEKTILRNGAWNFNDNDILFDYSNLTREEEKFEATHGYFFRQGQPAVVKNPLTLERALKIIDPSRVSSITPGNQVYQGFGDVVNGIEVPTIGSHLPGLHPDYVIDDGVRESLRKDLQAIYRVAWLQLISKIGESVLTGSGMFPSEKRTITLEVEPQIGDDKTAIYSGKDYDTKLGFMLRELRENLDVAINNHDLDLSSPYYLR